MYSPGDYIRFSLSSSITNKYNVVFRTIYYFSYNKYFYFHNPTTHSETAY